MPNIMLCADSASVRYPECLGLDGEPLYSQEWLQVLSGAQDAREGAGRAGLDEIWVAGSDEVDAINLAATIKQDGAQAKVCLLAFQGNGSLRSRAQAACIDEVWDKKAFLSRYRQAKGAYKRPAAASRPQSAAPQAARPVAAAPERGYLLSVVGAGGGVGKSSISVVAAYLAQSKGYKTALVDADLQFGDVAYLTGRDDGLPLDEACASPARLDSVSCRDRQPAIFSAPSRLERAEEVASQLAGIVSKLRERFDVVVVNTSPTWADIHLQLLEAGGNTLFVLDQRPSSIRACKHALQLCARCGVATQPIIFALNRCSRQSLFSSIDVTCALQGAHVVELAEGGRDVEELLGTGAPIELIDSGNPLCQSLVRLLADILPQQAPAASPQVVLPSRRRFKFGPKRKKAACL